MGGMRLAATLLIVALAGGCGHAAVGASAGTAATTAGGATLTTTSGALALGLVLTFGVADYINNPQPFPTPADRVSPHPGAPELAPSRLISEQDCTKPVDLTLGNLRCK